MQRQTGSGQHVQVGRDVSGGSAISLGGGVTIVINQGQPVEPRKEAPTTFAVLLALIADLKPAEHKSFMKFIQAEMGNVPLSDVDGVTMRRVHGYVSGIYGRRA